MLSIISSAKTLDFENKNIPGVSTEPIFREQTNQILSTCQNLSIEDIMSLMSVSKKIATLNYERFRSYESAPTKAALLAYNGDVYENIKANNFSREELIFANKHLGIISGLYGLLKPLDSIKPYRLEMGIKLVDKGLLSKFWANSITDYINKTLSSHTSKYLINLASKEYSDAIDTAKLLFPIFNIIFKESRAGKLQIIGINAKKARGLMLGYIMSNQIDNIEGLKKFSKEGYSFRPELSSSYDLIFIRE